MFKISVFRLNKKELNLLVLCCIIVISLLIYVFIIEPCVKKYDFFKKEVDEKRIKFLKLQKVLFLKEPVEGAYQEILPSISQIGSDEERFALFLKEVELSSRKSSVYITSLKPIGIIDQGNYKEYLMGMEAEGTMAALAKFLHSLPASKQLIGLKGLRIGRLSQQDDLLQFQMNLGRMIVDVKNEK